MTAFTMNVEHRPMAARISGKNGFSWGPYRVTRPCSRVVNLRDFCFDASQAKGHDGGASVGDEKGGEEEEKGDEPGKSCDTVPTVIYMQRRRKRQARRHKCDDFLAKIHTFFSMALPLLPPSPPQKMCRETLCTETPNYYSSRSFPQHDSAASPSS